MCEKRGKRIQWVVSLLDVEFAPVFKWFFGTKDAVEKLGDLSDLFVWFHVFCCAGLSAARWKLGRGWTSQGVS